MSYQTDDNGVIDSFMNQKASKSQNTYVPMDRACGRSTLALQSTSPMGMVVRTIVYDYTYGGGAYISQTTSNHVRLTKKQVPRQNWMSVAEAQRHGLAPLVESRNDTSRSTR